MRENGKDSNPQGAGESEGIMILGLGQLEKIGETKKKINMWEAMPKRKQYKCLTCLFYFFF